MRAVSPVLVIVSVRVTLLPWNLSTDELKLASGTLSPMLPILPPPSVNHIRPFLPSVISLG
ncbi:MAG: hypothetical protein E6I23_05605 [Chloroflexi bacterium]|nr:MAG: hypothetical protein E6I23_05605 [Chloroflexota bacterium]